MMILNFPVILKSDLIHVGRLDQPRITGRNSYEPGCLSVSECPDVWQRIMRSPQINPKRYTLNRADQSPLKLVCVHTLLEVDGCEPMAQYLIDQKLAVRSTLFQASYEDDEIGGTLTSLHTEYASALETAMEDEEQVTEVEALLPTEALIARLGFTPDPIQMDDVALAIYFEDREPEVDGLWWEDDLDPLSYSAPRGGLFQSRLERIKMSEM